jgi:hypothetical protein
MEQSSPNKAAEAQTTTQAVAAVYAVHVPGWGKRSRIRIGWTSDIDGRVRAHQMVVPDLHVLAVWATSEGWVGPAARSYGALHGREVVPGIYEVEDPARFIVGLISALEPFGIKPDIRSEKLGSQG